MIVFSWNIYVCWTPDVTPDLIGHLTLPAWYIDCDRHLIEYMTGHILYYVLSTLLFIYFIHAIFLSQYIYFLHMLTCYMWMHFLVYSYTFTRSSDSLNLYIQICDYLLLIRYLERIADISRSIEFSLFDYWYSHFL